MLKAVERRQKKATRYPANRYRRRIRLPGSRLFRPRSPLSRRGCRCTPAWASTAAPRSDRFGIVGPLNGMPNACAGQGYCSTAVDHTCHVQNDCRGQGGCGLYGTGEEMNKPGANDCRSLGSCATPINAERFSANGPNQGKSVWVRGAQGVRAELDRDPQGPARQAGCAARFPESQPLPATLGKPPAAFANIGPSYLWISANDTQRGNMTACGASGLSGAGGCS